MFFWDAAFFEMATFACTSPRGAVSQHTRIPNTKMFACFAVSLAFPLHLLSFKSHFIAVPRQLVVEPGRLDSPPPAPIHPARPAVPRAPRATVLPAPVPSSGPLCSGRLAAPAPLRPTRHLTEHSCRALIQCLTPPLLARAAHGPRHPHAAHPWTFVTRLLSRTGPPARILGPAPPLPLRSRGFARHS